MERRTSDHDTKKCRQTFLGGGGAVVLIFPPVAVVNGPAKQGGVSATLDHAFIDRMPFA